MGRITLIERLVFLLLYLSAVTADNLCGTQTCPVNTECRFVSKCVGSERKDCTMNPQCVDNKAILMHTSLCPVGMKSVLRNVTFKYYMVSTCGQCPEAGATQCPTSQVCCAPPPEDMPSEGRNNPETTTVRDCPAECRMDCEYGKELDENGCPACSCYEPCENVVCGKGQMCVVTGNKTCSGSICTGMQATCAENTTCPQVECRILCTVGRKLDPSGCEMCSCNDPCEEMPCPAGLQCQICTSGNCTGNGYSCTNTSDGRNNPETTTQRVCPAECRISCEYGKELDENGCPACSCYEPCEKVVCPERQMCIVTGNKTCSGPICTGMQATCEACPMVECRILCAIGRKLDSNGCEACSCNDPCENEPCPAGLQCQICTSGNCTGNGYTCTNTSDGRNNPETTTRRECPEPQCRMACEYGNDLDVNGCTSCTCHNPCKDKVCSVGQACVVTGNKTCSGFTCTGMQATCAENTTCPRVECRMLCAVGRKLDPSGCEMCSCNDPCEGMPCPAGLQCQICTSGNCTGNGYTCTNTTDGRNNPETSTQRVCPEPQCRMACEYGNDLDVNGCPTCTCHNPCKDKVCEKGQMCVVTGNKTCSGFTCTGMQTTCEVDPTCPQVECRMLCTIGRKLDSNGCEICACNDPCESTPCPAGLQCQICTSGNCTGNGYTCTNTSKQECAVTCRMLCSYGFRRDANGCELCECANSPCDQKMCEANQTCEVDEFACNYGKCYAAKCVKMNDNCTDQASCRMLCPEGRVIDQNGCELCHCKPSCVNKQCESGKHCQIMNGEAVCVECPLIKCTENCAAGYVLDENNCRTCECLKPTTCSQMTCDENLFCVYENDTNCTSAPCPLTPVCIDLFGTTTKSPTTTSATTTATTTTTSTTRTTTKTTPSTTTKNEPIGRIDTCPESQQLKWTLDDCSSNVDCSPGLMCCPSEFRFWKVCTKPAVQNSLCDSLSPVFRNLGLEVSKVMPQCG